MPPPRRAVNMFFDFARLTRGAFKDALSSCSSTYPKQERIETNGDGVKPGSPPAGLGGANVQSRRGSSEFEHFFGVPAESIFGGVKSRPHLFRSYTHTHATPARRLRRAQANLTGVCPLTWKCCSPSFPSGFPPPLGKSAVLLKCGIYFSFFLIEFSLA